MSAVQRAHLELRELEKPSQEKEVEQMLKTS